MKVHADFADFVAALNKFEVEYVIVGSFALAFHGHPRATGDLDIWVRPTEVNKTAVLKALNAFGFGDLNITRKTENGWSPPQRIPEPVSSASEEFGFGLAADNTLYFCSHRSGGYGGCDVWVAPCINSTWPSATNIGNTINTANNDCGAAIAPDQSFMVFWSNRPGGYGTFDLYISLRQPDGKWSEPWNLGEKINTRAYEMAASISPDGRYLFFTRHGREADIYWVDLQAVLSNLSESIENPDKGQ